MCLKLIRIEGCSLYYAKKVSREDVMRVGIGVRVIGYLAKVHIMFVFFIVMES